MDKMYPWLIRFRSPMNVPANVRVLGNFEVHCTRAEAVRLTVSLHDVFRDYRTVSSLNLLPVSDEEHPFLDDAEREKLVRQIF